MDLQVKYLFFSGKERDQKHHVEVIADVQNKRKTLYVAAFADESNNHLIQMVHKKYLLHKNNPETVVYDSGNVVTKHNSVGREHWKPEPIYKENIFVMKRLLDIGIMHGFLVTTWNGNHQDVITKGADQQQFQGTSEHPAVHTVGVGLSDMIHLGSKDHIKFLKSLIGRVVIPEGGKGKNQGIHKYVDNWVEIILRSSSLLTEETFQKFVKYLINDIEEDSIYSKEGKPRESTETSEIYKKELGRLLGK